MMRRVAQLAETPPEGSIQALASNKSLVVRAANEKDFEELLDIMLLEFEYSNK